MLPNRVEDHLLLQKGLYLELDRLQTALQSYEIVSIYFGGGTPSLVGASAIGALLDRVNTKGEIAPHCEITLEANPDGVTSTLMRQYQEIGINRISLGIQSLVDDSLVRIGRTHSGPQGKAAIEATFEAGIQNISIDLMYDLPSQSVASFDKTLSQLANLPITHLSLYNLTIEPHTSFWKRKATLQLPQEEESLAMLQHAISSLEAIGLKRYEVSAFAKPGFFSRHNTGYWQGRTFFGLGPSAFSYFQGSRTQNVAHLRKYVQALEEGNSPVDFTETLPYPQNVHEQLAIGLRVLEGIDLSPLSLPPETENKLKALAKDGYLTFDERHCQLTQKGLLFYDSVAIELI